MPSGDDDSGDEGDAPRLGSTSFRLLCPAGRLTRFVRIAPMPVFLSQVICMKLGKEVVPYSDRIMNILVEVFKNKNPVAQVCNAEDINGAGLKRDGVDVSLELVGWVYRGPTALCT